MQKKQLKFAATLMSKIMMQLGISIAAMFGIAVNKRVQELNMKKVL